MQGNADMSIYITGFCIHICCIYTQCNNYKYLLYIHAVPTHDQALQQVVLLKKELAEMRAHQALNEDQNIANATSSTLNQQVNRARGVGPQARAESDVERSAHRETMESLKLSENSVRSYNVFFFSIFIIVLFKD